MDELNPLALPDLTQAAPIEIKNMRYKMYAHIEYFTDAAGKIFRVCKPFGEYPVFFLPVDSLNAEYARDLEIIKKDQRANWPDYREIDGADENRDNDWMNANCFNNVKED
jgi:hypothetical protein